MITTEPRALAARRGRPRDPALDRAILDAARAVFAEKGFTGASMEAVASRAGVGKDTLYRRWNSKEALTAHLLTVLAEQGVPARSLDDDPRVALYLYLQHIVRLNTRSDFGALVAGIVGESARNPKLAAIFRAFWSERRRVASGLVREVVGNDAAPDVIERVVDHLVGPIYYRLLLAGGPITDEYLWNLVLDVPWPEAASLVAG